MTSNKKSTLPISFGATSQSFIEAGVSPRALIPIAPPGAKIADKASLSEKVLGKAPGRFDVRRDEWKGLTGSALREGMGTSAREEARDWPTGNVGLMGRFYPGIDSDALSKPAQRLVERVMVKMFGRDHYAERLRGDGPRRLYAFWCDQHGDPDRRVRTRHWQYRMPGETDSDKPHGLDILGYGSQYLIAGTHPSGDLYRWHEDRDLRTMVAEGRIEVIEEVNIVRFLEMFEEELLAAGGKVLHASGGSTAGIDRDYSSFEPTVPPEQILSALSRLPNTEGNFPLRVDLVEICAAIRAAAGRFAGNPDFYDQVLDWAVASSDGWCDVDYFDQIWNSLRGGVRVGRDYLQLFFRQHGIHALAELDFPDDAAATRRVIRGHKANAQDARSALLHRAADAYVFQEIDTSSGRKLQAMRIKLYPDRELDAWEWWQGRSTDLTVDLLNEIVNEFGSKQNDLFEFLRALKTSHPLAFYRETTKHPGYEFGAVVERRDTFDRPEGVLNLRRMSQAQLAARKPRRDKAQAVSDCKHFLDFVRRGFGDGESAKYMLDTLAYMAQTGKRPGHFLYLTGDQGVGKSIFADMLVALFDGIGPHVASRINGVALTNENSRRFIFDSIEGCRVVTLQELPKNAKAADMLAIIAVLKLVVDAGTTGNYLTVEGKGTPSRSIENHSYFVLTTNYGDALKIEEQDRRTFYVRFRIEQANKPPHAFYAQLAEIMNEPERLAAIWQLLERRDISGYRTTDALPSSAEKLARQLEGIKDDAERHLQVALATLAHNGRWIFDMVDLVALMNEAYLRETGDNEGPHPYATGTVGRNGLTTGAFRRLGKQTIKRAPKSNSVRYPTLYVLKARECDVSGMRREELYKALDQDRTNHPLKKMMPVEPYAGSLVLPVTGDVGGDDKRGQRRRSAGNEEPDQHWT